MTKKSPHKIYKKAVLVDSFNFCDYVILMFYTKEEAEEVEFAYKPQRHD